MKKTDDFCFYHNENICMILSWIKITREMPHSKLFEPLEFTQDSRFLSQECGKCMN